MRKVLLDLDGVLVDFVRGMCESHGRENPFDSGHTDYYLEKAWGMPESEFWAPSDCSEWWAELPKTEEADDIVDLVERYFGMENVCILTSPTLSPLSLAGKVEWIKKHYPEYSRKFLIGPQKHFCANPYNVLIDDHEINIQKFRDHHGIGILVPRPWNSAAGEAVIPYLESHLERL